jgi:hypothetical protein
MYGVHYRLLSTCVASFAPLAYTLRYKGPWFLVSSDKSCLHSQLCTSLCPGWDQTASHKPCWNYAEGTCMESTTGYCPPGTLCGIFCFPWHTHSGTRDHGFLVSSDRHSLHSQLCTCMCPGWDRTHARTLLGFK